MQGIQGVKAKSIAKYVLLPGVIPRLNAFIESGFGWLAFMMAVVYNGVRLLPAGHPYLNPQNMGKFGIRHVIAEAANNLVVKKENIDQIIIFFALLLGMVLLFLQVGGLLFGFFIKPAAALAPFIGLFSTPNPDNDIAFMLLDKVFGVPNLFNSSFAPAGTSFGDIPAFNRALQELFQYYSYAMLIVGIVIFLYYVIVLVGETANTGTPFGRRFNHIYAPLRLVGAIGLLVPLNYGLNSAQYITLHAAKFGSSFATNGWIIFNEELSNSSSATLIGTHKASLVARPNPADVRDIVAAASIMRTCKESYERRHLPSSANRKQIEVYVAKNDPNPQSLQNPSYQDALAFFNNKDIVITFGHDYSGQVDETEQNYVGNIQPLCGQFVVHTNVAGNDDGSAPDDQRIGAYRIQEAFYYLVIATFYDGEIINFAERMTYLHVPTDNEACDAGPLPGDCQQPPEASWKSDVVATAQAAYNASLAAAYNEMVALGDDLYGVPDELLERGWAGAAIWYNHIAEWNGSFFTAAVNTPTASRMPTIMENIQEERRSHDEAVDSELRYQPVIQGTRKITTVAEGDFPIADALSGAYQYWQTDGRGNASDTQTSGNVFFDLINSVFGIGGLFTMRQNDDVHPLAQLSALGKSIVESSIRNLLTALVFSAGGGMGEIVGVHLGAALTSISGMFVAFATIGLAIGFILYYILPFMPFMYFFFAVGGWVKTIFEAMVGVPLWALAHLKIDGNGFPGDSASNGYFLIFEIFVRPILTVFGLVASVAIFSAMARTLNGVFDLVVENLTGFDCNDCSTGTIFGVEYKRNAIDEFFFTIIYTILVYMLATSSFKLIDQIPNSILRWMGAGVQSFGDQRDDPAQGMVQYAAFGGANLAGQIGGALQQGARTAGMAAGAPVRGLSDALSSRNSTRIQPSGGGRPGGGGDPQI